MQPVHYQKGSFPPKSIDWSTLIPLLGPAAAAVARYDGMLAAVPNPRVLLSPLITQEAVLSSRIEGNQATMGEVLEFEAGGLEPSQERRLDIQEVQNYRNAMREAERLLATLPLSQRVIREVHKVLLDGVRGQSKSPGEYRRIPNWIGPPGCSVDNARFVPIGAEHLPNAMSEWERYVNSHAPDRLVQLAVLHAEFESLHPFLDGNGRLGRMMVPLFLWQVGLVRTPAFYISAFFEARRDAYYDGLLSVSREGNWTGWCKFFLEAVRTQAEENLEKALSIKELYDDLKRQVPELTRSQNAIRALDWIFGQPIFTAPHFIDAAGIPGPTARRILGVLAEAGILRVIRVGKGRRSAVLAFSQLLNIAEGSKVF